MTNQSRIFPGAIGNYEGDLAAMSLHPKYFDECLRYWKLEARALLRHVHLFSEPRLLGPSLSVAVTC